MLTPPAQEKRCLLILHKNFHSFGVFLSEALSARGYSVTIASDLYPENILGRLMGKLQMPLVFQSTYAYIVEHLLDKHRYDLAIIIRGRAISKKLVLKLKEVIPRVIGYNWDTFDFNNTPLTWYTAVDKYCTFDYADAERYQLPVLELFSTLQVPAKHKEIMYDLSAVGKMYPGRLKYIHRVLNVLKPARVCIRLHENSIFYMLINMAKNPVLYLKYWHHIHLKPISYDAYIDAIGSSEFTIDYVNNGQTGITMRCFETIGLQTRIITNNYNLQKSGYFNQTNSVIFRQSGSAEELAEAHGACLNTVYTARVRTIEDFMEDLLA